LDLLECLRGSSDVKMTDAQRAMQEPWKTGVRTIQPLCAGIPLESGKEKDI